MSGQQTPDSIYLPPTYLSYDRQLLYTEALPDLPPDDPLTAVTKPKSKSPALEQWAGFDNQSTTPLPSVQVARFRDD